MPRVPSRPGSLPVSKLPDDARAFAELPYAPFTEEARQYHLRAYERWCTGRARAPWPTDLETLLEFAADRAPGRSYYTIREHVRIVSMVERKRTGVDLYAHCAMRKALEGIKRECPPRPVQPLRPSQVDRLFAYRPRTNSHELIRTMALLSYAAGFTLLEHHRFRCEMIGFVGEAATIEGLGADRPLFHIGPAQEPERCPVRALRGTVAGRSEGWVYTTARSRRVDKHFSYDGLGQELGRFGAAAKVSPLSNDRIRIAGLIEQARNIDVVRLAHFHGYRSVNGLAALLGRYIEVNAAIRWSAARRSKW